MLNLNIFFSSKIDRMENIVTRLIIGLGNKGNNFIKTKHNAGYLFCDYFATFFLPELVPKSQLPVPTFEYDKLYDGSILSIKLKYFQSAESKLISKYDLLDSISERKRLKTINDGIPYHDVLLYMFKPDSFINNCGSYVENIIKKLNLHLKRNPISLNRMSEILVVHDDTGLEFGEIKLSHQVKVNFIAGWSRKP